MLLQEDDPVRRRFRTLMTEIATSRLERNSFQPWEIDLLLDIDQYALPKSLRTRLLRRYERAVLRAMAKNPAMRPFPFSDYLATTYLGRSNAYRRTDVM